MARFTLFGSARRAAPRLTAPTTDRGERIYAIGDVHGRYDLLSALLDKVEAHANMLPPVYATHVILLGDMVDRGPDSAEVLRFVRDAQQRTDSLIALMGNHEELMVKAATGVPGALSVWMRSGGRETLHSLGLKPPARDADPEEFGAKLRAAMPREWIEWLRQLPLTARSGDYFFCHAGVRPGIPLKRQSRSDLLWIRDDFLADDSDHGAMVVHGHNISPEAEVCRNRIGIDTGAYRTGVLTALYLEGRDREIIATAPADVPERDDRQPAEI